MIPQNIALIGFKNIDIFAFFIVNWVTQKPLCGHVTIGQQVAKKGGVEEMVNLQRRVLSDHIVTM